MKTTDFENSAHHTNALPVEHAAAAFDSNSPAALPTVAPDALIVTTRAQLNWRELHGLHSAAAMKAWFALLNHLAAFHPAAARN